MLLSMKIGIDTFGCDNGRSGRGSYLTSFIDAIPDDPHLSWELFGPEIDRYTYTSEKDFPFSSIPLPDSLNMERLWHLCNCNSFAKKRNYDLVFYASGPQLLPLNYKKKAIVLINDILSSFLKKEDSSFYKKIILKSLSDADCIIAGSNYIRQDIENCNIKIRRLEVIYSGIDHTTFTPIGKSENSIIDIKPFAIKKPYLIYPSRMQDESKKHVELIKAFSLFKERTQLPHRLVIAGSEGKYSENVRNAALSSQFASDIFLTGYFPHENFGDLYRNAEACIFPSTNEGVGLPVMESIACGLPVACSNSGALKEFAGEGAIYFNSDDVDSIESSIEQIIMNKELRELLIKKGQEKASEFSWEKTTKQTLEIIKSVCA